jgi:hypothetical protein
MVKSYDNDIGAIITFFPTKTPAISPEIEQFCARDFLHPFQIPHEYEHWEK